MGAAIGARIYLAALAAPQQGVAAPIYPGTCRGQPMAAATGVRVSWPA